MISTYRPYIAREGWIFILFALVCALGVSLSLGSISAIPVWLVVGLLAYVFRDPERRISPIALGVVSPVDGSITAIEKAIDPFLKRDATVIRIRMKMSGPFVVRSPIEGKVMHYWLGAVNSLRQETGTDASKHDLKKNGGNYHAIQVQSDEGDDIVLMLTGNIPGFKPRFYVQTGERIGQGQRCGFINFGCSVLILIAQNSRMEIVPGELAVAGTEIIATLVRK